MKMLTNFAARILFSVPFLVFGAFHFMHAHMMAGMVPGFLPGPADLYVYLVGACLIAGGLAIVTGIRAELACLCLAGLLAVFVFFIHIPGMRDPARQQMAMMGLLKDLGLMGGALALAGQFRRRN
ncbi:MAG: DoxX family membrane protein [Bdellovibrionota bacterium]